MSYFKIWHKFCFLWNRNIIFLRDKVWICENEGPERVEKRPSRKEIA